MLVPPRRSAAHLALAASLLCALGARPHTQEGFAPIFNGADLTGWEAVRTTAGVESGAIVVREDDGWLRLTKVLGDFTVRMDVKLLDRRSKGRIFVRSWPAPGRERRISNDGYSVVVSASDAAGEVIAHGRRIRALRFDKVKIGQPVTDQEAWHRYEITCVGSAMRVMLDGILITGAVEIQNPQGYLAFKTEAGAVAFKDVVLRELAGPESGPGAFGGAYRPGSGIDSPVLIREVKPLYTREALQARVHGVVLLEGVIRPDGTVGDVQVVRSLDPLFGLDQEALKAVRQWRFIPGKRQGVAVPVLVTFELTFTLK